MRTILMMCLATLLLLPATQASCHLCLSQAVEDCTALEADDCADSTAHLAAHAPEYAMDLLEGSPRICEMTGSCRGQSGP